MLFNPQGQKGNVGDPGLPGPQGLRGDVGDRVSVFVLCLPALTSLPPSTRVAGTVPSTL